MRGFLLGAGFVVCWSSGFIGASLADEAPVATLLAWRYAFTAALLVAVSARALRTLRRREIAQQAALGVLAHVVFLGGVFSAAARGVHPGTTALICALQPIVVAAAGRILWRDRGGRTLWASLALGLVAVAITVGGASIDGPSVVLPVAALCGLSASALLERRWQPSTPLLPALAVQVGAAAVIFIGWASVTSGVALAVDSQVASALGWLIVLSGLGGYATYFGCLRRIGATATSGLLYLTPAVTAVWAWAMLGSAMSASQLVGLALSLAAVALLLRPRDVASAGERRTAH